MSVAKNLIIGGLLSLALCTSASADSIGDNYWGGDPTNGVDTDVIGTFGAYDIDGMRWGISAGVLTVQIATKFVNNVGRHEIELGDLFISTDGWNPYGAAPYADDNVNTGEDWELVLVLDDHGEGLTSGTDYVGMSGKTALFWVDESNIELSSLSSTFRANQEVQYTPDRGEQALAYGQWRVLENGAYDILQLEIQIGEKLSNLPLGFHWTMTCANDVIEGGDPIPEPSSMLLLGGALLGGLMRRRRKAA